MSIEIREFIVKATMSQDLGSPNMNKSVDRTDLKKMQKQILESVGEMVLEAFDKQSSRYS